MNSQDQSVAGSENVMQLVGTLARSRSQSYAHYDHTYWGSALYFNWRGKAHGTDRDDSKPRADRAYLSEHGDEYDSFVFTEVVPIQGALDWAYSTYYLRKFYCEALDHNPNAEVFLYQTWNNAQPEEPDALDFDAQVRSDRKFWEQLADDSLNDRVANPGRLGRLLARVGLREKHCSPSKAFRFIPAGSAMLALSTELSTLGSQAPRLANGNPMTMADIFANAYTNWDEVRVGKASTLTLRRPDAKHDDIHPSAVGNYLVALVAYATIYRTDPTGLPAFNGVSDEVATLLQRVAWQTVTGDPRSGVGPARSRGHAGDSEREPGPGAGELR
jgi:hemerythrin superfamily protein